MIAVLAALALTQGSLEKARQAFSEAKNFPSTYYSARYEAIRKAIEDLRAAGASEVEIARAEVFAMNVADAVDGRAVVATGKRVRALIDRLGLSLEEQLTPFEELAWQASNQGEKALAVDVARECMGYRKKLSPLNARFSSVFGHWAWIELIHGEPSRAISALNGDVSDIAPNGIAYAETGYGHYLREKGNPKEARIHFEKALRIYLSEPQINQKQCSVLGDLANCARDLKDVLIASGKVDLHKAGAEGPVFVAERGPGEILGEMAIFDGRCRSATAVCRTDCLFLSITKAEFRACIGRNPSVAMGMIATLMDRLRESDAHVARATSLHVLGRLAYHLLDAARVEGGRMLVSPRLSDRAIGERVGCTRETVNRKLAEMESRGMVKRQRSRIDILDEESLQAFAGEWRM